MNQFDDIRPYFDEEVRAVLNNLLNDAELLRLISRSNAPWLAEKVPSLARWGTRLLLSARLRHVHSVADLQRIVAVYMAQTVAKTTTSLTVSGLDKLSPTQAYLFISNHRDIVLDPALMNFALDQAGFATVRIAVGDNLLKNRLVGEIMRLNKSFIVKRTVSSPRELRDTFMTLSSYINGSIADGHSIWIAQQEGRAKDGIDRTDPAIIKMFNMSQKQTGATFSDVIRRLNIVPVSLSYEYDPCDTAKARELEMRARTEVYEKAENEDIDSIISGITGFKGRVHIGFGEPLAEIYESPRAVAEAIDAQILHNYLLFPSNYLAYQKLRQANPERVLPAVEARYSADQMLAETRTFELRLAQCADNLRPYLLAMYANPVISALR
ncbi:1-acyl-sn-glycerol-3-phosphate acyltransferase [Allohahella marinimesophila]|uniref:1-acyl-sn-glycerol-3-phosphate acyltransferase n=1 Tax=Allohahella marinimesophila TaxID=1054972 RepID=A0ABP7P0P4_9GAMM